MIFNEHAAVVIGDFIHEITKGSPCAVEFPAEKIWELSKKHKDIILAHTHPYGMTKMSPEDLSTLHAWTYALPNRVKMDVITLVNNKIVQTRYWYEIESKLTWIQGGKIGERKKVLKKQVINKHKWWVERLIEISYVNFVKSQRKQTFNSTIARLIITGIWGLIVGLNMESAIEHDHHIGLFIISIVFFNAIWPIPNKGKS